MERIVFTNVVYNNASAKAKGIMPYIINPDGYLVALVIKHRREFKNPITVYYLNGKEAETIDLEMARLRMLLTQLQRQQELALEIVKSVPDNYIINVLSPSKL